MSRGRNPATPFEASSQLGKGGSPRSAYVERPACKRNQNQTNPNGKSTALLRTKRSQQLLFNPLLGPLATGEFHRYRSSRNCSGQPFTKRTQKLACNQPDAFCWCFGDDWSQTARNDGKISSGQFRFWIHVDALEHSRRICNAALSLVRDRATAIDVLTSGIRTRRATRPVPRVCLGAEIGITAVIASMLVRNVKASPATTAEL
jgi:hypothetical protein